MKSKHLDFSLRVKCEVSAKKRTVFVGKSIMMTQNKPGYYFVSGMHESLKLGGESVHLVMLWSCLSHDSNVVYMVLVASSLDSHHSKDKT